MQYDVHAKHTKRLMLQMLCILAEVNMLILDRMCKPKGVLIWLILSTAFWATGAALAARTSCHCL